MLWKYSLQWSGLLDAPSSLIEARQQLIEKLQKDPASFISKLEPAEPYCSTFADFGKKIIGMK